MRRYLRSARYGLSVVDPRLGRTKRTLRRLALAVSGGAVEVFGSGAPNITMTTTAAVTAGRLVMVSGDRSIAPAASATPKTLGVAKQDASAVGDKVAVATGGVWMLRAEGAIAAGDLVVVSAGGDGRVKPLAAEAATTVVGLALAAIADGADGPVLLRGLS